MFHALWTSPVGIVVSLILTTMNAVDNAQRKPWNIPDDRAVEWMAGNVG
jgi:hypothetical protein